MINPETQEEYPSCVDCDCSPCTACNLPDMTPEQEAFNDAECEAHAEREHQEFQDEISDVVASDNEDLI